MIFTFNKHTSKYSNLHYCYYRLKLFNFYILLSVNNAGDFLITIKIVNLIVRFLSSSTYRDYIYKIYLKSNIN